MSRILKKIFVADDLSGNLTPDDAAVVIDLSIYDKASVAFFVDISNGADPPAAPTSSPNGGFKFYADGGLGWFEVVDAGTETKIADQLAIISPVGDNARVQGVAVLHGAPGLRVALGYTRTNGGGAGTSCTVYAVVYAA